MLLRSLSFEEWRQRARGMPSAGLQPDIAVNAIFELDDAAFAPIESTRPLSLPAMLMRLLDRLCCFRSADRYALMYRLAWRTFYENRRLLEDAADADVRRATLMDAAIRRDVHKLHAFVRFREVIGRKGGVDVFRLVRA
jgi:uracil-DNA glycosylase